MRSHSSRSVSGTVLYTPIPALLQTKSSLPYSATAAATARCTSAGSETSPCANVTRPPACRISSAVRSPSAWLLSSVTRGGPFAGEQQRSGAPDPGGGAGQQADPPLQLRHNAICSSANTIGADYGLRSGGQPVIGSSPLASCTSASGRAFSDSTKTTWPSRLRLSGFRRLIMIAATAATSTMPTKMNGMGLVTPVGSGTTVL